MSCVNFTHVYFSPVFFSRCLLHFDDADRAIFAHSDPSNSSNLRLGATKFPRWTDNAVLQLRDHELPRNGYTVLGVGIHARVLHNSLHLLVQRHVLRLLRGVQRSSSELGQILYVRVGSSGGISGHLPGAEQLEHFGRKIQATVYVLGMCHR